MQIGMSSHSLIRVEGACSTFLTQEKSTASSVQTMSDFMAKVFTCPRLGHLIPHLFNSERAARCQCFPHYAAAAARLDLSAHHQACLYAPDIIKRRVTGRGITVKELKG